MTSTNIKVDLLFIFHSHKLLTELNSFNETFSFHNNKIHCLWCLDFWFKQNVLRCVSDIGMPPIPRPQLTQDQRNFVLLEYAKRRGGQNFFEGINADFQLKFPGSQIPDQTTVRRLYKKQVKKGTVNNCNSKSSPGDSHSGRHRSGRSPQNIADVKVVIDRDTTKRLGDITVSPVSSARRNVLAIDKSTWSRIRLELRYAIGYFLSCPINARILKILSPSWKTSQMKWKDDIHNVFYLINITHWVATWLADM